MSIPAATTDTKRHGRHYTPTELARFLAVRSYAHLAGAGRELVVVDPACGDGELLLAVAEAVRAAETSCTLRLVGYDVDPEAVALARTRVTSAGLRANIVTGDFLAEQRSMSSASVDLVITNPPYVRTQHLGQDAARLLAAEFGLSGRVDLTHPFVTVAARLLRPGGVLGLLCSNRVFTTLAGENVRRTLLRGELTVRELYDLGDTKLFRAAVLPAIVIANRRQPAARAIPFTSTYEVPGDDGEPPHSLFDALQGTASCTAVHRGKTYGVKVGTFVPPAEAETPWRLSDPESDEWLRTLERGTWKTFGEVAKVRVGIKTTADTVFLGDRWDRVAPDVERDLLRPLITQSNLTPWHVDPNLKTKVLYPYALASDTRRAVDLSAWPGAADYLLRHEEQLRSRHYVTAAGREWWEIWVPQRPALWAKPKIVFPDISEEPRFALDTSGAVVNGNCYWISLPDIGDDDVAYLMLAVANSSLGLRFYDEVCGNRLYSGKRRWMTQYVGRLPLPCPDTAEGKRLIGLARRWTAAHRAGPAAELDQAVAAAFAVSTSGRRASVREPS